MIKIEFIIDRILQGIVGLTIDLQQQLEIASIGKQWLTQESKIFMEEYIRWAMTPNENISVLWENGILFFYAVNISGAMKPGVPHRTVLAFGSPSHMPKPKSLITHYFLPFVYHQNLSIIKDSGRRFLFKCKEQL